MILNKMLRIIILPLLLFTLSMACMGQTFQYSRGWTNGKRASPVDVLAKTHYYSNDENLSNIYDFPDSARKLERCLIQLHNFYNNALLQRNANVGSTSYGTTLAFKNLYSGSNSNNNSGNNRRNSNNNNNNNDNSLYPNHHQSSELFEELNNGAALAAAAAATASMAEPNDYGKH